MSADADKNVAESQFQKPGDLVERDDDTGVMQVESLCMNCHESVRTYSSRKLFLNLTWSAGNHPAAPPACALLP